MSGISIKHYASNNLSPSSRSMVGDCFTLLALLGGDSCFPVLESCTVHCALCSVLCSFVLCNRSVLCAVCAVCYVLCCSALYVVLSGDVAVCSVFCVCSLCGVCVVCEAADMGMVVFGHGQRFQPWLVLWAQLLCLLARALHVYQLCALLNRWR